MLQYNILSDFIIATLHAAVENVDNGFTNVNALRTHEREQT